MELHTLGQLALWRHPVAQPRARVLMLHGIREHSGRHLNTVQFLTSKNFEVIRFDFRGCGKSGGTRQYIDKFSDYVQDTIDVLHWSQRTLKKLPLILHAHSMGGAVAVHFATHYGNQFAGMSLSSPAYLPGSDISQWKVFVGRILAGALPGLRIPTGSDLGGVSRDVRVVEEYQNDPLCPPFNTLRQGDLVLRAMEKVPELVRQIRIPSFIVHGTSDRIIQPLGSYTILRNLGSPQKELHFLPGGFHESHNDLDKDLYFQHLNTWLDHLLLAL